MLSHLDDLIFYVMENFPQGHYSAECHWTVGPRCPVGMGSWREIAPESVWTAALYPLIHIFWNKLLILDFEVFMGHDFHIFEDTKELTEAKWQFIYLSLPSQIHTCGCQPHSMGHSKITICQLYNVKVLLYTTTVSTLGPVSLHKLVIKEIVIYVKSSTWMRKKSCVPHGKCECFCC